MAGPLPSTMPAGAAALGEPPAKSDQDVAAVADALEIVLGKRPTDEQVEAFCIAAALGVEKHAAGGY